MRRLFILNTIILIVTLNLACNESSVAPDSGMTKIIMFDSIDDLELNLDPAIIYNATVLDDTLELKVSFSGGCKTHKLSLYGSKAIAKSYPPQALLYLSHNANNDNCEAMVSETHKFDLTPLKNNFLQNYNNNGTLLLAIYEPHANAPYKPLPVYSFN